MKRGWTGLTRGKCIWENPELRASVLAKRDRPLKDRLAKFTDRRADKDCWLWTGSLNNMGYGKLTIHSRQVLATHIALEVDGKPRPDASSVAMHACDNPACVNPHHLRWGSLKDNTRDGYAKGRIKTPTERRADRAIAWLRSLGAPV